LNAAYESEMAAVSHYIISAR